MKTIADIVLMFLILSNLAFLGISRLKTCIRILALQGLSLGILPFLIHIPAFSYDSVLLAVGSILLRGLIFPYYLEKAMRKADVRHEVEPFIGYSFSILFGMGLLFISAWLGFRLQIPYLLTSRLLVPSSLFTIMTGLFILISRRKALSQVIGYLVMENGIYTLGITLVHEQPFIIELGILLDIFAGVFIMGIMIFHISRAFDHIDIDKLSSLKE
ncbi:MAG: hydrogenase [Candidatus Aureabacteria bacterium]|nr:hydrogenase [Candidatus Auribacterota bacterium]